MSSLPVPVSPSTRVGSCYKVNLIQYSTQSPAAPYQCLKLVPGYIVAARQQFLDVEIPSACGVLQTSLLRQGLSIDLHYHRTPLSASSGWMERKSFLSVWRAISAIAPASSTPVKVTSSWYAVREIFADFS